jgi:hypothetical protein
MAAHNSGSERAASERALVRLAVELDNAYAALSHVRFELSEAAKRKGEAVFTEKYQAACATVEPQKKFPFQTIEVLVTLIGAGLVLRTLFLMSRGGTGFFDGISIIAVVIVTYFASGAITSVVADRYDRDQERRHEDGRRSASEDAFRASSAAELAARESLARDEFRSRLRAANEYVTRIESEIARHREIVTF